MSKRNDLLVITADKWSKVSYTPKVTLLKRSINLAYLEDGTYDQIVAHLQNELELSGKKNDDELPIPTVTVAIARDNEIKPDFSKTTCI